MEAVRAPQGSLLGCGVSARATLGPCLCPVTGQEACGVVSMSSGLCQDSISVLPGLFLKLLKLQKLPGLCAHTCPG